MTGEKTSRTRRERRKRRSLGSTVLGGFGEILITVGVLGLLFVVWELWWTGLEAESERQEAVDDFYSGVGQPGEDEGDGDDATQAGEDDADSTDPVDVETCYTLDDGTEIACAHSMRDLANGTDTMAMLYAPRLGDDWAAPVREGVEAEQIDRGGVGRYSTTQYPDEPGNFAVAGHRNTYASMLGRQDELEMGDQLYLMTPGEGVYTFEVVEREVVSPDAMDVLAPVPGDPDVDPDTGMLTLTTCHPMYSNAERLIHHAEIVDFDPHGGDIPQPVAQQVEASGMADELPSAGGQ